MSFTFKTPAQKDYEALLASKNNAPMQKLTPKEKFDKYIKKVTLGSAKRQKKYHFVAIDAGKEDGLVLFNGLGRELKTFSNDFHGQRECRCYAYDLYMQTWVEKIETILGGYTYTVVDN